MPLLNVALVPAPDRVVARIVGDVDLSTSALLADGLSRAARLAARDVIVDVAAAHFWDCSGLRALAAFTADLAAADRACRIVGAPATTRRLIVVAGLSGALDLDGPVDTDTAHPGPVGDSGQVPPAPRFSLHSRTAMEESATAEDIVSVS